MSNEITTTQNNAIVAGYSNSLSFEFMQRQAQMLASSALMPKEFSIIGVPKADQPTKIANVMIALEMANRIGASPLMVCQNIYIVHGRPSWSSQFIIAAINGCGRFTAMKFEMKGEGDDRTCVAVATEKVTGERMDSPAISITTAKEEGWYGKAGSKWRTMPELMLRYRAATLFGRLYAPEILMGMKSVEEVEDIEPAITTPPKRKESISERLQAMKVETIAEVEIATVDTDTGEIIEAETESYHEDDFEQIFFRKLGELANERGESPDDTIDTLTNGRITVQQDIVGKPEQYIKDLILLVNVEINKNR